MKTTRLSLFYLIGYLVPSGLLLLFAPQVALTLLFSNSNGSYGDVIPRLAGVLALALGLLVVQIVRLKIEGLYTSIIAIRVILITCILGLYFYSRDPFFISLAVVIGLGILLSLAGYLTDRRAGRQPMKPA